MTSGFGTRSGASRFSSLNEQITAATAIGILM